MIRATLFALAAAATLQALPNPLAAAIPTGAEADAYATFGVVIGQNLRLDELQLTDAQFDAFVDGLRRHRLKQAPPPLSPDGETILESIRQRVTALQQNPASSPASDPLTTYLTAARQEFNLQQSESGLLHRILNGGVGPRPRPDDTVVLDIAAKAPDMSTALPQLSGTNARSKVSELLPGLAEGVQMLTLGSSQLLVLPPHLSFGNHAWPDGLQPGMPLVFQVTLKEIVPAP